MGQPWVRIDLKPVAWDWSMWHFAWGGDWAFFCGGGGDELRVGDWGLGIGLPAWWIGRHLRIGFVGLACDGEKAAWRVMGRQDWVALIALPLQSHRQPLSNLIGHPLLKETSVG